jgi:curved DNA-binding protein CbpA
MNPYLVLGVPLDADDEAIRRAYLSALKLAPPDLAPQRFQDINTAYEQIKDEPSRHRRTLFNEAPPGDSPLDVFLRYARLRSHAQPLSFEAMKEFLRSCSKI